MEVIVTQDNLSSQRYHYNHGIKKISMNYNPKRAEENKFSVYFSFPSPHLFTRGFILLITKKRFHSITPSNETRLNHITSHHINSSSYSTVNRHVISLPKVGSRRIIR